MSSRFWAASAGTLVSQFLVMLQAFIFIPVIIKFAGAATFGAYTLVSAILSITFAVSTLGVGFRAKRFLPSSVSYTEKSQLFFPQFWWQLIVTLLLALLCFLIHSLGILKFFGSSLEHSVAPSVIAIYLVGYFLYAQAVDYFRYTHRVLVFNIGTILLPYGFLIAVFLLEFYGIGLTVNSISLCFASSALFVGIIFCSKILMELGIHLNFPTGGCLVSEFRYGLPIVANLLIETVLAVGDRFLIAWVLTSEAVGYYVPAYTIGSLMLIVPRVLGVSLPVSLAKLIDEGDPESAEKLINETIGFFLTLAIPFVVGSFVLGQRILELYTNSQIAAVSWQIIPVVAFGTVFYGIIYIYVQLLNVLMKTSSSMKVIFYAAVFNIGLNIIFLPFFRTIHVAAVTTLISYFAGYILINSRLRTNWKARSDWSRTLRITLASSLMGCASLFLLKLDILGIQPIVTLFINVLVSALVYFLACLSLGVTTLAQLVRVARVILPRGAQEVDSLVVDGVKR